MKSNDLNNLTSIVQVAVAKFKHKRSSKIQP